MLPGSALVGILACHNLFKFKLLSAEPDALPDHQDGIRVHRCALVKSRLLRRMIISVVSVVPLCGSVQPTLVRYKPDVLLVRARRVDLPLRPLRRGVILLSLCIALSELVDYGLVLIHGAQLEVPIHQEPIPLLICVLRRNRVEIDEGREGVKLALVDLQLVVEGGRREFEGYLPARSGDEDGVLIMDL